jgi:DNA-directed RNA polymerase specialized sigma subunit
MKLKKSDAVMSQTEVAKKLGIDRGLVNYIEKAAMVKIKKELKKRGIDPSFLFKD